MGRSLDLVLENQGELGLSPDQVVQLQELQAILDQDVTPVAEEMRTLREMIQEGETDRDEAIRKMKALKGQLITNSAPLHGRIREILTAEQHQKLQPLVRQNRPRGGRAGPVRGRRLVPGRMPRMGSGSGLPLARGGIGLYRGFGRAGGLRSPALQRGVARNFQPGRTTGFIRPNRGRRGQPPPGVGRGGGLPPGSF